MAYFSKLTSKIVKNDSFQLKNEERNMTPFETATAFFHACESLKGWEECHQYTTLMQHSQLNLNPL
ncbi:MAG: hypothetical protein ACI9QV_001131 [Methylophagaceae bacterium]|jgi:hypothetical protein